MSRTYIVRRMPAKELSPEQLAEAAHLKTLFREWQAVRRENGDAYTQDDVAETLFGFGQSALSQYLNGTIPLNPPAVAKFAEVLGKPPSEISPLMVQQMRKQAAASAAFLKLVPASDKAEQKPIRNPSIGGLRGGIRKLGGGVNHRQTPARKQGKKGG